MDISTDEEFWCELVLNGIGGRTIAKAKANISYPELKIWRAYRAKRGSLFFGRRLEQVFGRYHADYIALKIQKEVDVYNFMPHEDAPETSFEEERMKAIRKKSQ
ncbi:hypothetical protein [Acinetobacter sp. CFCC 10889]|uniref:hypothetical protein n=1 Tax=Acinetobacter sp. CFCC 10889 TaxID=1775557 RepID=UPI001D1889FB|nr:hypothetical protein [Acinetobacter sp. CFCC 10889]